MVGLLLVQASNGDMAPMKPPGGVLSAKDAAKDSSLATFNDRLHEVTQPLPA